MESEPHLGSPESGKERLKPLATHFGELATTIAAQEEPLVVRAFGQEEYNRLSMLADIELDTFASLSDEEYAKFVTGLEEDDETGNPVIPADPLMDMRIALETFQRDHLAGYAVGIDDQGAFLESHRQNEIIHGNFSTTYTRLRSHEGLIVVEHYNYAMNTVPAESLNEYRREQIDTERAMGLNAMPISELEANIVVDQLAQLSDAYADLATKAPHEIMQTLSGH